MLLFSMTVCHGGAVQWDTAGWGYDSFFNTQFLWVTAPDGGGVGVGVEITSTYAQATIHNNLDWGTTGYAILLLQTDYNTWVDDDLFNHSFNPFFNKYTESWGVTSETNLSILLNETIIVAFAIGGLDYWSGEFLSEWYGWIEFGYTPKDGVYIANSGVETTGQGLYAGVIPEPSTALLAMSGCVFMLLRRRKRFHTRMQK